MKKKTKVIIPVLLIAVLVAAAAFTFSNNRVFSKGIIYIDGKTVYFLDKNNSPIIPGAQNGLSKKQLDKLSSGDEVLMLHNGIAESYPAQTGAFLFIKTGRNEDIPEEAINGLGLLKDEIAERFQPDENPTGDNFLTHQGNGVDDPVYATCGNTVTKVFLKDGKYYSFMYDDSVFLHNLIGNLKYSEEDNEKDYEIIIQLEDGVDYEVNLSEGWIRATAPSTLYNREKTGICTLTDAQIQAIQKRSQEH